MVHAYVCARVRVRACMCVCLFVCAYMCIMCPCGSACTHISACMCIHILYNYRSQSDLCIIINQTALNKSLQLSMLRDGLGDKTET